MATAQSYPTPQQNYFLAKKSDKTDVKKGITVTPSRLHQDFEVLEELGAGAFGQVYRCRHRLDGSEYAVKKMKSKIRGDGMKFV
jgi:serine/threonine protein kinase